MSLLIQLHTWDGGLYLARRPLSCSFCRGAGTPCDSFEVTLPYERDMASVLPRAVRLTADRDGRRLFTGLVDEYEIRADGAGGTATLTGRGLAALLLDDQVPAAQFGAAALADILKIYVEPTGILLGEAEELPGVADFTVSSGSSRWQALAGFTEASAGIMPRFDPLGKLVLKKPGSGRRLLLPGDARVLSLRQRERRYGRVSRVTVVNRRTGVQEVVADEEFERQGGHCQRVVTVPKKTTWQAMRYMGQYQIGKSRERSLVLTLELPGARDIGPEDLLTAQLSVPGLSGTFRVGQVTYTLSGAGETTALELLRWEA